MANEDTTGNGGDLVQAQSLGKLETLRLKCMLMEAGNIRHVDQEGKAACVSHSYKCRTESMRREEKERATAYPQTKLRRKRTLPPPPPARPIVENSKDGFQERQWPRKIPGNSFQFTYLHLHCLFSHS